MNHQLSRSDFAVSVTHFRRVAVRTPHQCIGTNAPHKTGSGWTHHIQKVFAIPAAFARGEQTVLRPIQVQVERPLGFVHRCPGHRDVGMRRTRQRQGRRASLCFQRCRFGLRRLCRLTAVTGRRVAALLPPHRWCLATPGLRPDAAVDRIDEHDKGVYANGG